MSGRNPKAVIVGASQGIGAKTAKWLALKGWDVAICARNRLRLNEVSHELRSSGSSRVLSKVLDASDSDNLKDFADQISEEWGGVSLLICSAAVLGPIGSIRSIDPNKMREAIDINVLGTFNSVWAFSQLLFQQEGSRAVLLAGGGLGGARPIGGAYGYVPSKAFSVLLVELLSREFAANNGAICSISPGLMSTGFMKPALSETASDVPDDLANAARAQQNLISDDLAVTQYFHLMTRFLSSEGLAMNGKLISARWDQDVIFGEPSELYTDSMFQLRRIDDTMFTNVRK